MVGKRLVRFMYGPWSGRDVEVDINRDFYSVPILKPVVFTNEPFDPRELVAPEVVVYRPASVGGLWYPERKEDYYKGKIWDGYRPEDR